MFEPRIPQPTDQDLVELLATRGMGWKLHNVSGHRPGSRDIPHAWRWLRDRIRIMVYLGGDGPAANVEFDPLNDAACAAELVKQLASGGINVNGWDLATADGRRKMCEAAAERLKATARPDPAAAPVVSEPAPLMPTVTAHTLPDGETFPPAGLVAKHDEQVSHGG